MSCSLHIFWGGRGEGEGSNLCVKHYVADFHMCSMSERERGRLEREKADVVPHSSHWWAVGRHYKQIVVSHRPHTISAPITIHINIRMHIYSFLEIHIQTDVSHRPHTISSWDSQPLSTSISTSGSRAFSLFFLGDCGHPHPYQPISTSKYSTDPFQSLYPHHLNPNQHSH